MKSLGFSSFRELLDRWDNWLIKEDEEERVRTLLDGNELLMFFKKGDDYFGAPEESRLTFAKMKDPGDDMPMDGASFMAINLARTVMGEPTKVVFNNKDMKQIKIVDRDEVEKKLLAKVRGKDEKKPVKTARSKKKQKNHGLTKIHDEE